MRRSFRSLSCEALVIKYKNLNEADRLITIFCQEKGKILVIAKGLRKLKSSKRAYLEPGNLVKIQLIIGQSLPILTQATLISDLSCLREKLSQIRSLQQILEVIDKLFVEEELELDLYQLVIATRDLLLQKQSLGQIKHNLGLIVQQLGYLPQKQGSLLDYISQITDRPMNSFEFLKI